MLGEVVFISFFSFYTVWFGYGFVANRWKSGTWPNIFSILHYYSGLAKKADLIRYSQTVNLAFIEHTSILIYMFIYLYTFHIELIVIYKYIPATFSLFLLLLCLSISWKQFNLFTWSFTDVFDITWTITYSKKASQLKDLCWVILGYIEAHFGGVLLFIESC